MKLVKRESYSMRAVAAHTGEGVRLCTKIQNDRRILSQEHLLSSRYCGVELIFVQSHSAMIAQEGMFVLKFSKHRIQFRESKFR
jgi:hypothetical protein